jgi:hypothetical protein
MNHNTFWEKYLALSSEEESRQYLKNYLFSLPPVEMKRWILSETQSIVADLKKQINDPSVSENWKTALKEQFETAILNIEHLSSVNLHRKAA